MIEVHRRADVRRDVSGRDRDGGQSAERAQGLSPEPEGRDRKKIRKR